MARHLLRTFQNRESRTPQEIIELLKAKEIWAKPIGLYRIVAQSGITDEIWRGYLGRLVSSIQVQAEGVKISVNKYDVDWLSLVQRLTFGAYGLILDVKLPKPTSPYWRPHVTRDLGFAPADRNNKRFFHYLELDPHLDSAAWDERSIPTRISVDLRRDFAYSFVKRHYSRGGTNSGGGTISIGPTNLWAEGIRDHLGILGDTITQFTRLLSEKPDADESVFHEFLERNPIMLDAYGDIKSKPRFVYPPGESPVGKEYVEPDFIVCYPNNSYKLIELESPSKNLGTERGEPRADVTQAAFQIAEWKTYILKHYDRIREEFPGISLDHRTMIVISRATEKSVGPGRGVQEYLELVKNQLKVDEVFTYDDLAMRATSAYARLSALSQS